MPRRQSAKEERNRKTRETLLQAAAEIVGIHGYAGASVQRITDAAGIAQGTFYLHFNSRQELFDQLLPFVAHRALDHLRDSAPPMLDFFDREERAFRAFFAYLLEHPYYYRVLGEAETMAPLAFEKWFSFITSRYARNLERAALAGQISGLSPEEIRFMSVILLACRRYVYQEFVKSADGPLPLPDWVPGAYITMLRRSLDLRAGLSGAASTGDAGGKPAEG